MKTPFHDTIAVTGVNPEGFFTATTEGGHKCNVFYTDIGETLHGEIFKRKRKLWCRQHSVIDTISLERTVPLCPHFGECGGCDLRHLSYERQCVLKTDIAHSLLGNPPNAFIHSPRIDHYRNYAAFNFEYGKTGFYKKMSRSLLDIHDCLLMDNVIQQEHNTLHDIKETFNGEIRIKTCDDGILRRDYPKYVSKEATVDTLVYAQKTIGGIPYFVSPDTFFQSNDYILPEWLSVIETYAQAQLKPNASLIDLYCGAGTISLWLARSIGNVIGIENNPLAVHLAEKSIAALGLDEQSVRYETGDLFSYDISRLQADMLIVNPPRGGLSPNVLSFIQEKRFPAVVYSSCNIQTFARDVAALHDYTLVDYTVVDMFPHTFHFETVGLLTRKED